MGFKNSTDGALEEALHGTLTAREAHTFIHIDAEGHLCGIKSEGNPHTHIVLRGADQFTNYDSFSVKEALEKLQALRLPQKLMIDCSHGNCHKNLDQQKKAFFSVLEQMQAENSPIFGLMLESHLEEGNQPLLTPLKPTVSVTDPCLSWEDTEELILEAHSTLSISTISL